VFEALTENINTELQKNALSMYTISQCSKPHILPLFLCRFALVSSPIYPFFRYWHSCIM